MYENIIGVVSKGDTRSLDYSSGPCNTEYFCVFRWPWALWYFRAVLRSSLRPTEASSFALGLDAIWGFPKIRGTFLGVPRIMTIVFGGLY